MSVLKRKLKNFVWLYEDKKWFLTDIKNEITLCLPNKVKALSLARALLSSLDRLRMDEKEELKTRTKTLKHKYEEQRKRQLEQIKILKERLKKN